MTRTELDEELMEVEKTNDESVKKEPVLPSFEVEHSHLVNTQFLDIDVKPAYYNEEIETDEELDA